MDIDQYLHFVWNQFSLQSLSVWTGVALLTAFLSYKLRINGFFKAVPAKILPFFAFYLSFVITITLTDRTTSTSADYHLKLFWTYRRICQGSYTLVAQIFWNIVLFIPIGIMVSEIWTGKYLWQYATYGLLLSGVIEFLQLLTHRGLFEFDDMFHNTIGMVIGCLIAFPFKKSVRKIVILSVGVFICLGFLISWTTTFVPNSLKIISGDISDFLCNESTVVEQELNRQSFIKRDDVYQYFCFQIDRVIEEDGVISMDGFAFPYNIELSDSDLHVFLLSDATGDMLEADVQAGLERDDVNRYFSAKEDYIKVGFRASISLDKFVKRDEYAIYISWPYTKRIFTGVYLIGTNVHYTSSDSFLLPGIEGTDLEPIVRDGILQVYRPDYSCYVYQYKGSLYWIVNENFNFEEDGGTFIQFQLYTTLVQNLPQNRLRNNWYWDNISGLFEDYEITDKMDCGQYRVCKRALPTEYSITSILTGYYVDDAWVWKNYFRPYYEFE